MRQRFFSLCLVLSLLPILSARAWILPDGGEQWQAGKIYRIEWSPEDFPAGPVDIVLWDGYQSDWLSIAGGIGRESGGFDWIVPAELEGTFFRVKVQNQKHPEVYQMSSTYFSIIPSHDGGVSGPSYGVSADTLVRVSPVPASDLVMLAWEGEAMQIRIWDIPGRMVFEQFLTGSTSATFSVSKFLPGFYGVEVKLQNGKVLHGRMIVTR